MLAGVQQGLSRQLCTLEGVWWLAQAGLAFARVRQLMPIRAEELRNDEENVILGGGLGRSPVREWDWRVTVGGI